jgi:hypothetical protein
MDDSEIDHLYSQEVASSESPYTVRYRPAKRKRCKVTLKNDPSRIIEEGLSAVMLAYANIVCSAEWDMISTVSDVDFPESYCLWDEQLQAWIIEEELVEDMMDFSWLLLGYDNHLE